MAEVAVDDYQNVPVPRKIKISSKRQITIPADVYKRHGFTEYAMLEETEDGFTVLPFNVADNDEELTLLLLRYLVGKGYEGEELISKYEEMRPSFFSFHRALNRSEEDIVAGRVVPYEEMMQRFSEKYGL